VKKKTDDEKIALKPNPLRPNKEKWVFALIYLVVISVVAFFYFQLTHSGDSNGSIAPVVFRGWIGGRDELGSLGVGLIFSPLNLVLFFGALLVGGLRAFFGDFSRGENVGLVLATIFSGVSVMASTPWLSLLAMFFVFIGASIFQLNKQSNPTSGIRLANWMFERTGALFSIGLFLIIYFSSSAGSVWLSSSEMAQAISQMTSQGGVSPAMLAAVSVSFLCLCFSAPVFSIWETSDDHPESLILEGMVAFGLSGLIQKLTGLFTADLLLSRIALSIALVLILSHFILTFITCRARPLWGVGLGAMIFFAILATRAGAQEIIPLFGFSMLFMQAIFSWARENFPKKSLILGLAIFLGAGGVGSTLSSLYMVSMESLRELPEQAGAGLAVFLFTFACWRLFWLSNNSTVAKSNSSSGVPSNHALLLAAFFLIPLLGLFWTGRLSGGLLGFTREADLILPSLAELFLRGPSSPAHINEFTNGDGEQAFMIGAVMYWSAHVMAIFAAYWTTAITQNRLKQASGSKVAGALRWIELSAMGRVLRFIERWTPQVKNRISWDGKFSQKIGRTMARHGENLSQAIARFEGWTWSFLARSAGAGVRASSRFGKVIQVGNSKAHLAMAIWIAIILWVYLSGIYLKLFSAGSG